MNLEETLRRIAPNAHAMVSEWAPGEGALLITEAVDGISLVIPMPRSELLAIMVEGLALHAPDVPDSALDLLRFPPRGSVPWIASSYTGATSCGVIIPRSMMVRGGDA